MRFICQIFVCLLILNCKSNQSKNKLGFTIIHKESISNFKNKLEILTKANELREKNIDFIAYKDLYIGSSQTFNQQDPNLCPYCLPNESFFLIWKENDIEYLQIFDNCGNFIPIKIENEDILDFVRQNFETLKNERVKFYQVDKNTIVTASHSRFKQYLFSLNNEESYNEFDTYNLKSFPEEINLNYAYNQSLNLIRLDNMIEAEIKNQTDANSFKRDLTQCK